MCDFEAQEHRRVVEQRERERERQVAEERSALADRANVPARFATSHLEDWQTDSEPKRLALRRIAQLIDTPRTSNRGAFIRFVVLYGRCGTGKTMAACALVNACVHERLPAVYLTERELIRRIRGTWQKDAEWSEEECLIDLYRQKLLVMDDIGTSIGTDAEKVHLFDVIDGRYRGAGFKPGSDRMSTWWMTILCTNLDRKALAIHLGDRLFDRIQEDSVWISFDWESHRGRKGKEVLVLHR